MKKLLQILLVIALAPVCASAQWIDSFLLDPPNPTTADVVSITANMSFSSGSCDQHSQFHTVAPPYIYANSLHCVGMLAFICSASDVFTIGMLPAGNYTFVFHVDAGSLPFPCTPGINPGPTDSVKFTVVLPTAIPVYDKSCDFILAPNPSKNFLNIKSGIAISTLKNKFIEFSDVTGQLVMGIKINDASSAIDISHLPNGIYFCTLRGENFTSSKQKLVVMK